MTIHPYTDKEWDDLPHVILTSELDWDPGQLDLTLEDDENWYDAISDIRVALYVTFTLLCKYCLHMYPTFIPMYVK